jgi:hypothetical protein
MEIRFKVLPLAVAAAALGAASVGAYAQSDRPEEVNGHPNLNGIWQATGTAYWNLEAHSAEALPDFWRLGAFGAIPAGQGVVVGGNIPYRPEMLERRDANRAGWPKTDPAAACYLPGIPRANYMPFPFQIVQGDGDILFVYSFAKANRAVHMSNHVEMAPVDQWLGWSNGSWDGDTLVVTVNSNDDRTWLDRAGNFHSSQMVVTERFTLIGENHMQYEATIDDPVVFTEPWTIRLPLYRNVEPNAELLEYNCVEFSEPLLYGEFLKEPIQ